MQHFQKNKRYRFIAKISAIRIPKCETTRATLTVAYPVAVINQEEIIFRDHTHIIVSRHLANKLKSMLYENRPYITFTAKVYRYTKVRNGVVYEQYGLSEINYLENCTKRKVKLCKEFQKDSYSTYSYSPSQSLVPAQKQMRASSQKKYRNIAQKRNRFF